MDELNIEFIKILKLHLEQKVSYQEVFNWLVDNIKPLVNPRTGGWAKPGLALHFHIQRMMRSYINDLNDQKFPKQTNQNLDWYWVKVREYLDLLLGNKIYRTSGNLIEYSIEHNLRKYDEWMLPSLRYAEGVLEKLSNEQNQNSKPNIPDLELELDLNNTPFFSQTSTEIIMPEILNTIEDYKSIQSNNHLSFADEGKALIERLDKLIRCFRGEKYYSYSVTFEGINKFAITIVV